MSEENVEVVALDPAVEQEARGQGWVPLTEFRDNEDKWVDAETFVKRGREINPILRKNNEILRKELAQVKASAAESIQAAKDFREFQKENFDRKVKEYSDQIEQLKSAKREAIKESDGDRVVAIDDAIDKLKEDSATLKKPEPHKETPPPKELDSNIQEWVEQNQWYGKDTEDSIEMTEITNGVAAAIRKSNPSLIGKEFLNELDRRIEKRFPEVKGKPKREIADSKVDSGGSGSGRPTGGKPSYDKLPDDAKKACDRFVSQGLMTKEQYVADYYN